MLIFRCLFILWTLSYCCSLRVFQGCYRSWNDLSIDFIHIHAKQGEECFSICSHNGHRYIGIGKLVCTCTSDIPSHLRKVDNSECSEACSDNTDLICGGLEFSLLSIYTVEADVAINNATKGHQGVGTKFGEEPLLLLAGHGGIYSYTYSHNSPISVIKVESPVYALDYHLRKKEGIAIWDNYIWRFPLFGERPLGEHESEGFSRITLMCPTFAVDWVHDKIYWPDCFSHRIMMSDLWLESDDTSIVRLHKEGAWAFDMKIDPYKGLLFWTTGATLWSVRLDGRGLRKVVPAFPVNRVSTLSLDLTEGNIYFFGQERHKNSSGLHFARYNGQVSPTLPFLEHESGSHLHVLIVGFVDSYIYYIKNVENNNSVAIMSKLEFNITHEDKNVIKGIQPTVARLVHPRLQAPGEVDKCTDWGCSHLCLLEHALPRCHCPRHHELEHDNKTCVLNPGEEEEAHILVRVALGLMLVLVVLLAAGVLMCICDGIWSRLRPTVVRLSDPTATYRSSTVERLQDSENLI